MICVSKDKRPEQVEQGRRCEMNVGWTERESEWDIIICWVFLTYRSHIDRKLKCRSLKPLFVADRWWNLEAAANCFQRGRLFIYSCCCVSTAYPPPAWSNKPATTVIQSTLCGWRRSHNQCIRGISGQIPEYIYHRVCRAGGQIRGTPTWSPRQQFAVDKLRLRLSPVKPEPNPAGFRLSLLSGTWSWVIKANLRGLLDPTRAVRHTHTHTHAKRAHDNHMRVGE